MTVTVKHSKTNAISDWTQAQLDEQIALGNFAEGTVLADIVLPSDWNNDHTLTGVGTMAEQDANNVAITGGSINGTTIGATTASTGKFTSVTTPSVTATTNNLTLSAISTGAVRLQTANGISFTARDNGTTIANYISSVGTSGVPYLVAEGSGTNVSTAFSSKGTGSVSLWTNNASQVQFSATHTASAVNYVQVTGSATTPSASTLPSISTQGSDTNTYLGIGVKGTGGYIAFYGAGGTNAQVLRISSANASSTNNLLQVSAAASGSAPILSSIGTDTNIDLALTPKGTGVVRFGTYTANMALTVQGYIEIKDSGGTLRKLAVIA